MGKGLVTVPDITGEQADRMAQEIEKAIPKGWSSAAHTEQSRAEREAAIRAVLRKWLAV
jgi:hypothetical protein